MQNLCMQRLCIATHQIHFTHITKAMHAQILHSDTPEQVYTYMYYKNYACRDFVIGITKSLHAQVMYIKNLYATQHTSVYVVTLLLK